MTIVKALHVLSIILTFVMVLSIIGVPPLMKSSQSGFAQSSSFYTIPGSVFGQNDNKMDDKRPNILVVVADDFGFSDLKPYGGDIIAPNLDKLANESSIFTNFHIMPVCSPSRSVIMTGVDVHKNGMGTMDVVIAPNQVGKPGYETYLNDKVTTIAQILKDSGYHTYTTGKWHLGDKPNNWPYNRGFEESYTLLHGGASNWNGAFPISAYLGFWVKNNEKIAYPNGTYSSDLYADELIKMISKNSNDSKPFYAYLAFQANHWPLQAPAEYIESNDGRYEMGWNELREQRLENQKKLGIFDQSTELGPSLEGFQAIKKGWDDLTTEEKSYESKRMEVYSAMAQAMDYNIGKVIDHLKKIGQYENTLIIFTTDNGATGTEIDKLELREDIKKEAEQMLATYNNSESNIGSASSFLAYGPGWAQGSNTPFKGFKGLLTEGGIRVPFIVKTPGESEYKLQDGLTFVSDVVPTLLDYAGATYPKTGNNGNQLEPLAGKSIIPVLEGQTDKIYQDTEFVPLEYFGNKAVFNGNWKALNVGTSYGGDSKWHLYDLNNDPSETNDMSSEQPGLLNKMVATYNEFANQTQIIEPNYSSDTSIPDETEATG